MTEPVPDPLIDEHAQEEVDEEVDEEVEEEVDFLLTSLDDLDAERVAGDLDDDDYATLRDGYTARAAELLRARQEHRAAPPEPSAGRSRQALVWVVGVLVVAGITGALLARSVGSRGANTSLTGSGATARERAADCLSISFQEPAEGIECYDAILEDEPDNVEALTYQGWALVRTGETERGSANFDRVVELDPTYPDVHVFRASVRNAAGDPAGAQAELDALYALDPPAGIISTLQSMGLDREVAYELLPTDLQACWDRIEEAASTGAGAGAGDDEDGDGADGGSDPAALILEGLTCATEVADARPDDLDALEMQGYLLGAAATGGASGSGSDADVLLARAREVLDRAVELAPDDPTPRLLRAAVRNISDDPAGAVEDLDALDGLGRPSALYVVADPDDIRVDAERALARGAGSTTASTTTSVP